MAIYPSKFDVPHNGLEWLEWYSKHKVYHPAWDLNRATGNQDYGDPCWAVLDGEIEYVSPEPTTINGNNGGLGWFVVTYHPAYGVWFRYAHLSKVLVKARDKVKMGQELAKIGNSGTLYAHLHFEGWTKEGWEIQKNHWRKYAYYPTGKSKAWVQQHYFDPLAFIDEINNASNWKTEIEDWVAGYLKEPESFFADPSPHKIAVLIKKVFDSKNNGK